MRNAFDYVRYIFAFTDDHVSTFRCFGETNTIPEEIRYFRGVNNKNEGAIHIYMASIVILLNYMWNVVAAQRIDNKLTLIVLG